jgi:anaerobic selenocysteine-containing dehydrogenase
MSIHTGDPSTFKGGCPQDCPDTCAMTYTVDAGKLVSVRGAPEHPITRGGLCVKLKDFAKHHYNPDRLLYPQRRVGPKGSGQYERITWAEALETISSRWKGIIAEHGTQAILNCCYLGNQGILNGLTSGDAFFNRLGATVSEKTFCASGSSTGYLMTVGPTGGVDPESFVHSRYIIVWGLNTLSTNLHQWPIYQEAKERGAKIVVIDPQRSRTAQLADWHIRPKVGTDAALAMGMMHVLITESLVDQDYIDRYTHGYGDLKERVLAEYPVSRVAEITGVPAEDIQKLAREFAAAQPAVIRMGVALERNRNGGQSIRAVSILPALVGAWRHVGGGLLEMPLWEFPLKYDEMCRPDFIRPGTRVANLTRLGHFIETLTDPPIKSLFVNNSNPVSQAGESRLLEKHLKREDFFLVVSELFLTDTAKYADIILPATMQAEQLEVMLAWGHFYLTFNEKAIEAPGECVPNSELFRRLAKAMGFQDAYWDRTDEEMLESFIDWTSPKLAGWSMQRLRDVGYVSLAEGGVDTRKPHAEGNFPTPTGKCELRTTQADKGNFVVPVWRSMYTELQPGEPVDPLPHWSPLHESLESTPELAARFPLNIISPKPHAFLNSQFANEAVQRKRQGPQTVTLHPQDAERRGIEEGAAVRVFNDRGSFRGQAIVSDVTLPGLIVAPVGYWHEHNHGSAVNVISSSAHSNLGHAPSFFDNLVEVERVA